MTASKLSVVNGKGSEHCDMIGPKLRSPLGWIEVNAHKQFDCSRQNVCAPQDVVHSARDRPFGSPKGALVALAVDEVHGWQHKYSERKPRERRPGSPQHIGLPTIPPRRGSRSMNKRRFPRACARGYCSIAASRLTPEQIGCSPQRCAHHTTWRE